MERWVSLISIPETMPHIENLIASIDGTSTLRGRIVWLVGLPGTGKTSLLYRLVGMRSNYQHININKVLCGNLLDDAPDKRRFISGEYLADILRPKANNVWLVDNIEVLFSNELKLSIVDSLKALAQQAPLVVSWPGKYENGRLIYGARYHLDYYEYPLDSPVVVDLNYTNIKEE
jgi:hypothetical protein